MKQSKIWRPILAALIIWMAMPMSVMAQSRPLPSHETIEMVKMELATMQNFLPIEGGIGMLMTAVEYDDATNIIKYRYRYTIPGVTKPSADQVKEARKLVIAIAKTDQRQKQILEEGISFRYDYYSADDEFLYSSTITPEDIAE